MKSKSLIKFSCLVLLAFCSLGNAGVAIDGKEYKNTVPVTEKNFTDAEAEYNFLRWWGISILPIQTMK